MLDSTQAWQQSIFIVWTSQCGMGTPKVPKTLPRGSHGQTSFPNNGCMCAQPLQSCQTLCNPRDCSPPGSSVCGIFQVRILEWINLPGGLPGPGTEPVSPAAPALQVDFFFFFFFFYCWDTGEALKMLFALFTLLSQVCSGVFPEAVWHERDFAKCKAISAFSLLAFCFGNHGYYS